MAELKFLRRRVKASSLLETLVAAVLLVVIFGIAMMIFTNVLKSAYSVKQMQAEATLKAVANDYATGNHQPTGAGNDDLSADTSDLRISTELRPSPLGERLLWLHLSAANPQGRVIAEYDQLIVKQ